MNLLYKIMTAPFFFFLCISNPSLAQNESLHFEHIGFDEGSSNEEVMSIMQDTKGYIWFGTMRGLNKYDGYSFTKYWFDPVDSNSISQGLVYTIFEDKFGSIWAGTTDGMSKFDRTTEKFARFKPSPNSKFPDPNITAITEDSEGMMWVGSFGGLCRFDRQRGIFLPDNFDLVGIFCIYKDRDGTLWIGSASGLYRLNLLAKKNNQLSEVTFTPFRNDPANPNSLSSNNIRSIFEDRQGIFWLATDNGLNSFDRKTGIVKRYQYDARNIHSISTNRLDWWFGKTIQEDPEGNLWIGTENGLNKLNAERSAFTSYFHNSDDSYSLSTNKVMSLHIDKAGILFASSWGGKLNIANLNVKGFALRRHDPNSVNSLSSNAVTSIIEDSSGIFWIGTYGGGLNRWNKNTNHFTHFKHKASDPKTLKSDSILAVLEDHHGHLWVCNGGVLSRLNRQTGEFDHYYSNVTNDQDPHARFIYSIIQDRDGFLWLGTGFGIRRFDERTGQLKYFYHDPTDTSTLSDGTATAVFADKKGYIWVGYGSKGTDKLDGRSFRFIRYKYNSHDSNSISSNVVNCFFEDPKGNIWLGTLSGGLSHFDYQTGKFSTVTDKNGLPSNTIYSILNDNNNQLWLGTENGLSRFDPIAKTFTNYDYKDGLQGNIFASGDGDDLSWGACCKDRHGTLYFGGNNGFNFFNPLQLKASSHIAPMVVTRFKLFDSLVKGAHESEKIVLEHDQNYFSFEFASLSYYNPAKNQYRYKLEGVDKDWVYSGSRRYVGYTNVEPGTYVFKVTGTSNDGVWNEEGTFILITINPPWWRTWFAYTVYGLLLVAAVFAIYRMQKQRIIRKERQKTQLKELAQAKEIEKAYNELRSTQAQLIQSEKMASLGELTAGIAHEIQNPLNFINNFSDVNKELLSEMKDEMKKGNIDEANSIAKDVIDNEEKISHHGKRADAIVKGMLQHSRTSSGQKEPTDLNALANEYLRLAYHGFKAKDKTFNAKLITDFDVTIGKINIISQDIGRALLNLYNNAFYAVNEKANLRSAPGGYEPRVTVRTSKVGSRIEIRVKDNGNGIPAQICDKIFQPFFTTKPTGQGTGLGLSLSYDIIKAHGGDIKVESSEGEGSTFIVNL